MTLNVELPREHSTPVSEDLEWRFWRMGMSEQADGLVAGWCLSAAQFVHGQIE
ncbi:hypothetical protein L208DRAFT_1411968, partial [Tricholoma matsutake]